MKIVSNKYNIDNKMWDSMSDRQQAAFVSMMLRLEDQPMDEQKKMLISMLTADVYEAVSSYPDEG